MTIAVLGYPMTRGVDAVRDARNMQRVYCTYVNCRFPSRGMSIFGTHYALYYNSVRVRYEGAWRGERRWTGNEKLVAWYLVWRIAGRSILVVSYCSIAWKISLPVLGSS